MKPTRLVLFILPLLLFGMMVSSAQNLLKPGPGTKQNGVSFERHSTAADINSLVGEQVCLTMHAKDANGNLIRSWDRSGQPVVLTLQNSQANIDSSNQSWNADPDGFSYAKLMVNSVELPKISPNEWSLSNTLFVDGTVVVCVIDTKAESGITVAVTPLFPPLIQVSDIMNFRADAITNYLVALTSSLTTKPAVFQMRKYEITVSPRDKYLNISNDQIRTRFSARFPGEFDASGQGLSDIFSNEVFIAGPTNYFLASRIKRELPMDERQWIRAYSSDNDQIYGVSDSYEVLTHAPSPFALLLPVDYTVLVLDAGAKTQVFSWEQPSPPDPYTNITVSNTPLEVASDEVTYTWVCVDSISLSRAVRMASDNSGVLPKLTLTYNQLRSVGSSVTGYPNWDTTHVVWSVEATDGLYITKNNLPPADPNFRPGFRLTLKNLLSSANPTPSAGAFRLEQNFPNPFNPSTTIRFSLTKTGMVTLKVYDLVGNEISTVVNKTLPAGEHAYFFNAEHLPTGVYIYKITAEGQTLTRRMMLVK